MPVTEDEDGNTSVGNLCSDGVGDPYLNYNVTDDGETQEISATVYQVLAGKSEHTQYKSGFPERKTGKFMPWLETAIPTVWEAQKETLWQLPFPVKLLQWKMERLRQKAVK